MTHITIGQLDRDTSAHLHQSFSWLLSASFELFWDVHTFICGVDPGMGFAELTFAYHFGFDKTPINLFQGF